MTSTSEKLGNDSFTIPPLRSLNDFLLQSARFQVPDFKDLDKWARRVNHNLLYYQSNYFLMAIILFLLVSMWHPKDTILGCLASAVFLALFTYLNSSQEAIKNLKQNYPIVTYTVVIISLYFIFRMFNSVMVFAWGILVPILASFIHASLRRRNIKNKVTVRIESITGEKTPMKIILEQLGLEYQSA